MAVTGKSQLNGWDLQPDLKVPSNPNYSDSVFLYVRTTPEDTVSKSDFFFDAVYKLGLVIFFLSVLILARASPEFWNVQGSIR